MAAKKTDGPSEPTSPEDLAEHFATDFAELHAQIAALKDGDAKRNLAMLADSAHKAMNAVGVEAISHGLLAARSGGLPKP